MRLKYLFLLILLLSVKTLSAQKTAEKDTVETARKLSYEKKFKEAVYLLQQYEVKHPNEVNAVRLHAQILYWMREFDSALLLLNESLNKEYNLNVQLDYGRMLFELNRLDASKKVMEDYLVKQKDDVEALNTLGTIEYWQGEPTKAIAYFDKVLKQYPNNDWALKYLKEIKEIKKPFIKLSGGYSNDTQPLSLSNLNVETGWYQSKYLAPKLILNGASFDANNTQRSFYSLQLENKFSLAASKLEIVIGGGLYKSPVVDTKGYTAIIEVKQKLSSNLVLTAHAKREPYFYTLSSLQKEVTYNQYGLALVFYKPNSWQGWVGYSNQQFMDQNNLPTYGAWFLFPSFNFDNFKLALGYSFAYSTADIDNFKVATPTSGAGSNGNIAGVYDPYFTPKNQTENAALLSLLFKPKGIFSFSTNTRLGIYSFADRPYFYYNQGIGNQFTIKKDFSVEKFTPVEIIANTNFQLSNRSSLQISYIYMKTYFYNNNFAKLMLYFRL